MKSVRESPVHTTERVTKDPAFTDKARSWFDRRYDFASEGVYFPHQPIYGFSRFIEHINNYWRTYHILRALKELEFSSFLDVGCAEGYFANIVRRLFGVPAFGTDFAASGVRRAWEIYGIPGVTGDAHCLPFKDRAFDMVLCSETLEHVAHPEKVVQELMRVAAKYVVVTTPAARSEAEREEHFEHVDPNLIFDHFHFFTEEQLREWLGPASVIQGCAHRRMARFFAWMSDTGSDPRTVCDLYRFVVDTSPGLSPDTLRRFQSLLAELAQRRKNPLRRLAGPGLLKLLLRVDYFLSRRYPEATLTFLTITPCHGTPLVRRQRRIPNLLQFLLVENRVEPYRLPGGTA